MSRRVSPATGAPYRLARVCRVWRLPRSSVYRRRSPRPEVPPLRPTLRPGPVGAMADAAVPI